MNKRFSHLPSNPEEARVWRLKMPVEEIGYLNSIYEAYEGMCIVNTTDKRLGLVECTVMPAYIDDFLTILNSMIEPCRVTILEEGVPYAKPSA